MSSFRKNDSTAIQLEVSGVYCFEPGKLLKLLLHTFNQFKITFAPASSTIILFVLLPLPSAVRSEYRESHTVSGQLNVSDWMSLYASFYRYNVLS
jgi:hypothetical protein